jgi:hypothetical protein
VQPADIALELRPRSAWEAMDLGLAMLQRWWRQVYFPHIVMTGATLGLALLAAWQLDKPWLALVLLWWLKPAYDRLVLHVLSRAVFGEVLGTRAALGAARDWLASGLLMALTLGRLDLARSFNLPVRQLEGQRGAAARERRGVLGRRARGNAVWLTVVCLHFEAVLYWSFGTAATLLLPASGLDTRDFFDALRSGEAWTYADVVAYAAAILVLEPFYVAAGFALYLNRRTLLEGWDLEVALRRLAARFASLLLVIGFSVMVITPQTAWAQKDPKKEMAEVLKAPEFPHERDAMRWVPRNAKDEPVRPRGFGLGRWVAEVARLVLWALVVAVAAYALWKLAQALPAWRRAPPIEPYRPPAALFGMELAPESLPADVPGMALQLLQQGRTREALALLYRGSLSRLVHERGVQLAASHTEQEVLSLAPSPYLQGLVDAWRACAYAQRLPAREAVAALAAGYARL